MVEKKLRKSYTQRSLVEVCGGIAEYFNVSPLFVRLIFIFTPVSLLVYIILANVLEDSPPSL